MPLTQQEQLEIIAAIWGEKSSRRLAYSLQHSQYIWAIGVERYRWSQ